MKKTAPFLPASVTQTLFLVLFLFALGYGLWQMVRATTWGAGLPPDAVSYIQGARSILENGNLSGLSPHWPPLYPLAIALSGIFSDDLLVSLRQLQLWTYGANFLLFATIIFLNTRSSLLALTAGALLSTSIVFLQMHAMAWSEGLFCLFAMLGFFFLARGLRPVNYRLLLLSALCVGMATLTRYAGVAVIISGAIAVLIFLKGNVVRRLTLSLVYGFVSSLPLAIWAASNLASGSSAVNRSVSYHPVSAETLAKGFTVFNSWFLMPGDTYILFPGVSVLIAALLIISKRVKTPDPPDFLIEICLLFTAFYIVFISLSITFVDAHTPLDNRILAPAYLFLVLGLTLLVARLMKGRLAAYAGVTIVCAMLLLALFQSAPQTIFVDAAARSGIGWAAKTWRTSPALSWLEKQQLGLQIFTNAPEPIMLHTNRSASMLPRQHEPARPAAKQRFRRRDEERGPNTAGKQRSNHLFRRRRFPLVHSQSSADHTSPRTG